MSVAALLAIRARPPPGLPRPTRPVGTEGRPAAVCQTVGSFLGVHGGLEAAPSRLVSGVATAPIDSECSARPIAALLCGPSTPCLLVVLA